jgi:hypothetical protein
MAGLVARINVQWPRTKSSCRSMSRFQQCSGTAMWPRRGGRCLTPLGRADAVYGASANNLWIAPVRRSAHLLPGFSRQPGPKCALRRQGSTLRRPVPSPSAARTPAE